MPVTAAYKRETPPCPPEEYGLHVIADIHTRKPVAFICQHCGEVFDWQTDNIFSHSLRCPVLEQQGVKERAEHTIEGYRKSLRRAAQIRRLLRWSAGRDVTAEKATQELAHWQEYSQRVDLDEDRLTSCLMIIWALERRVAGLPVVPTEKELLSK
ncbi:MAG TPA: hypothetical protein VNE17_10025 [Nitrolancea sp.]|nr:hypothetical protein [Nitrolancea sp.]